MSWRPLSTFEDFLEVKQDFDQIPIIHVSYASSYRALLHPIVDIWEDLDTLKFLQHGEYPPQVTSSHRDCIQQWSKRYSWKDNHLIRCLPEGDRMVLPPHEWPGVVLFKRYTQSLDNLELSVLIAFSFLITIGKVCMFKSKTPLLSVNNVIQWELLSPLDSSCFLHSLFKAIYC